MTMGGETSICHLDPGHKADGATFNRFGLLTVMKSADDPGEIFLDDIPGLLGNDQQANAELRHDRHRLRRHSRRVSTSTEGPQWMRSDGPARLAHEL